MATDEAASAPHPRKLGTFLRGLSPLGPIFAKELRITARLKRTYVLRFCYLALLLLVLLFVYAVNYWDNYGRMGVAREAQRMAEMGIYFFGTFSFFTMGAMALLGPILTSTAINSERLHKTLPVLLMTPITAWQIVAGKLFSRLLIAFTLIGLSLPVLALVRLLGGVEIHQMFASLLLCVTIAISSAAIGLFFSVLMNRAYAVILMAYGFMGVMYGLVPLLLMLVLISSLGNNNAAGAMFFQFMGWTSPALAMFLIAIPERPPFRIGGYEQVVFVHLVFSAILILWTALVLRRRARIESEGGAPAPGAIVAPPPEMSDENGQAMPPVAPTLLSATAHLPYHAPTAAKSKDVSDNPVLWRELRRPLLARRWQRWGLSLFILGCLGFIYVMLGLESALDDPDVQIAFGVIFCGLLNLVACILAGSAIAQEKESDTWTLLLVTPLSARKIVLGKFLGLLRKFTWPAALIAGHFALFTIFGVIPFGMFLTILYLIFVFNVVWLATGLYFSLRLKTVTFAVIANLLLPAALYIGVLLVATIVGALFFDTPEFGEFVGLYTPYVFLAQGIDDIGRQGYLQSTIWVPCFGQVNWEMYYIIVFFAGLGHLAATAGLLWHTIVHFNRIVGRANQDDRGRASLHAAPA